LGGGLLLEGGEGAGGEAIGLLLLVLLPALEEDLLEGLFVFFAAEFGDGCERAEGGVEDDFVYGLDGSGEFVGPGEVGAGDLEGVEDEAGAAGVYGVGGEAADELADGLLDGGAVLGEGEVEGGFPVGQADGIGSDGFAGGVVVVAEVLAAKGAAAAAVAVGEDVTALEDGCW
jgi:hypothetical protein